MKQLFSMSFIAAVLLLAGCQSQPLIQPDNYEEDYGESSPFVHVDGLKFIRNGKPYFYVGTNMWYGAYLGATPAGQQRLVAELDLLQQMGVDNLRVLALSEKSTQSMAVSPAIQTAPGVLDENLLQGLDFLLEEMAKRDMLAVLYLNNFWQWSGGMSQYVSWLTGNPPFDPDVTGDWSGFMQNSAEFYSAEEAQAWYQTAIEQLVKRVNTVNGKAYIEDPTIMSWQLANEPRPGSEPEGKKNTEAYLNWIDKTAQFIKGLDETHLVSTGIEGTMGTLQDMDIYRKAHAFESIDYLTFHLWPKNWSWLDINDIEGTYKSALAKSKSYIFRHIDVAKSLNKPTVLEEFGMERDGGSFAKEATVNTRDHFYNEIYSLIETQAKLGGPMVGSNFWAWGGVGEAKNSDYIWRPGNPFTGDPPQEPQGLFSVFATDQSTINVITEHAKEIKKIR